MRILFISTFYPPYVIGGWEQLVEDLVREFSARGHQTLVLTSKHGLAEQRVSSGEPGVKRVLELESDLQFYRPSAFFSYRRRVQHNSEVTRATIEAFRPSVVFVHSMWNLSRCVPWVAEQLLPGRVVYYMADHWPYTPDTHDVYWRDTAGSVRKAMKKLVSPLPLRIVAEDRRRFHLSFAHVLCVSHAIRRGLLENTDIPAGNLQVVYNGINLADFPYRSDVEAFAGSQIKLLYAGSLVPHKGVHVAIQALAVLQREHAIDGVHLTIVGSGRPDYEAELRAEVSKAGLGEHVDFVGRVPRAEMPQQLAQQDVLIFPSAWPEPLARMTQEAMAMGVVVVGTTTGGTGEILVEGDTGLTFAPGDAAMLAAQRILELRRDPALYLRLSRNARARIERQFDIERMYDQTEHYLAGVSHPELVGASL